MEDCVHNNRRNSTIGRDLNGHIFSATTEVCIDCGAELWSNEVRGQFNKWLNEIGTKARIQFKMSHVAEQLLDKILVRFPGATKTVLVRAMIAVYLDLLKRDSKVNDIFNQIFESEFYQSFANDKQTRLFPTDVRAFFFFDIQSWGKSFGLKPNEMASESFHLMMALCVSEDSELKEFWTETILPQLETIIKAA